MNPVIYVVVNKGLGMSPGKVAAQVGHAVAGVISIHRHPDWMTSPHRWMIVLEGEDEMHLRNIWRYLDDRDIFSYPVIDEGVNEVRPFALTALGVEVLDKGSQEATYLSGLRRYVYAIPRPSKEWTEIWNQAIDHMHSKSWWKRLLNK